jgi:hypothetical protein
VPTKSFQQCQAAYTEPPKSIKHLEVHLHSHRQGVMSARAPQMVIHNRALVEESVWGCTVASKRPCGAVAGRPCTLGATKPVPSGRRAVTSSSLLPTLIVRNSQGKGTRSRIASVTLERIYCGASFSPKGQTRWQLRRTGACERRAIALHNSRQFKGNVAIWSMEVSRSRALRTMRQATAAAADRLALPAAVPAARSCASACSQREDPPDRQRGHDRRPQCIVRSCGHR